MTANPTIRVDARYCPPHARQLLEADDLWRPIEYAIRAHHATELSHDATSVVERRLERLTLRLGVEMQTNEAWELRRDLNAPGYLAGLRLLVTVLLVAAFVAPTGIVIFGGKWLPCALLAVVLVLSAASVSAFADSVEE